MRFKAIPAPIRARHRIRYAHTRHSAAHTAEEVAAGEHLPPHRIAKTVVFQSSGGYLMVVVSADSDVDLEKPSNLLPITTGEGVGLSGTSSSEEQKATRC
jgi:Uncharacterized conserved protein